MIARDKIICTIAAFFVVGLSACSVNRNYKRTVLNLPEKFRGTDTTLLSTIDSSIAQIPYQIFFKDAVLLSLIDKGVAKNYDMQIALKQVEYAEQSMKQAQWGYYPTISATIGNASFQRPSTNSLNGSMIPQFLGQSYITDFSSYLQLSWEADIWGKIKNRKSAALSAYLQTAEARKTIQTKLVSSIAQGYYNLMMLDRQLEITRESILLFENTLSMTKLLRDAGDATSLAVQQQEAALEAAKASIPVLEKNIAIQENAISILTGENPGTVSRSRSLDDLRQEDDLAPSYPASLLANRPDVRQAEFKVKQALAQQNVAHANMYPTLAISAQGGVDAVAFSNWFNLPSSLFGTIAGSLTTPLLQGRQLKTQYKQAQINTEQVTLQFKQSVQTALGEVSDALITIDKLKPQQQHTQAQVDLLGKAVTNAQLLYKQGMTTYLDVLTAQNNKLQAELNLAAIEAQRLSAVVTLYRSLGGGWK